MHTSSRKINVTYIFSRKSKRNTYLHPLIKFLLPNTLPFGKTWWAPSQNLSRNTKTRFIKSQSKQVCLSCCIKKIPSYLLMGFLHQCLIPISTLIYMFWFLLPSRGMGAQDKWLHLTLKKHPLSQSPPKASQMALWEQFLLSRSMTSFLISHSGAKVLWALTTPPLNQIII